MDTAIVPRPTANKGDLEGRDTAIVDMRSMRRDIQNVPTYVGAALTGEAASGRAPGESESPTLVVRGGVPSAGSEAHRAERATVRVPPTEAERPWAETVRVGDGERVRSIESSPRIRTTSADTQPTSLPEPGRRSGGVRLGARSLVALTAVIGCAVGVSFVATVLLGERARAEAALGTARDEAADRAAGLQTALRRAMLAADPDAARGIAGAFGPASGRDRWTVVLRPDLGQAFVDGATRAAVAGRICDTERGGGLRAAYRRRAPTDPCTPGEDDGAAAGRPVVFPDGVVSRLRTGDLEEASWIHEEDGARFQMVARGVPAEKRCTTCHGRADDAVRGFVVARVPLAPIEAALAAGRPTAILMGGISMLVVVLLLLALLRILGRPRAAG